MATAEQYAEWIVKNQGKKGTPEFETVAKAYKLLREDVQPEQPARSVTPQSPWGNQMGFDSDSRMNQPPSRQVAADVLNFATPTIEALGTLGGGALGAASPIPGGAMLGAGLGYGMARRATNTVNQLLGQAPPETVTNAFVEGARDVAIGTAMEGAGQLAMKAINPVVKAGQGVWNSLFDAKGNAYRKAVGSRGGDIVNALRDPNAVIVPGSAPSAGQVAAPVGSTSFSKLQSNVDKSLPGQQMAADRGAQNLTARQMQQGRVEYRVAGVVKKVTDKIDKGMVNVSPRDVGESLIEIAKTEQKAMRNNVINPAYEAAFKAAGDTPINVAPVVKEAENILGAKLTDFAPESAPQIVRALIRMQPKTPPAQPLGKGLVSSKVNVQAPKPDLPTANLKQLDELRQAINSDIASAKTSMTPMSATQLANLRKLHTVLDDVVKGSGISKDAKDLYGNAVKIYRESFVPRFRTGENARLFKSTSLNEPKLNPDDVVKRYFQPEGEREALQFVSIFGKNKDAMNIGRAGFLDLYRRNVTTAEGVADFAKHNKFMKDYARPIEIMEKAGMPLRGDFQRVGVELNRLKRIDEIAKKSGINLGEPLPAGANATAIEGRIKQLTAGLSKSQIQHLDSVRKDLARDKEFMRLASIGTDAAPGIPDARIPNLLERTVAYYNRAVTKLSEKLGEKMAHELARELSNPRLAADMIEKSMAKGKPQGIVSIPGMSGAISAGTGTNALLGSVVRGNNSLAEEFEE